MTDPQPAIRRCKTCGGKGTVTVNDPEEGKFEAMCPHCHGFGVE